MFGSKDKDKDIIEEDVIKDIDTDDLDDEESIEYTPAELAAMEKGWNPDKDNVAEGKEWVDAGEFLRRESFFDEIRKLKRANKHMQKSFDTLKEHHAKVAKVEYERALTELKRQKKIALEEDDHSAIIEIDDKIADMKVMADKPTPVEMQEADNSAFEAWVDRNRWYETNDEMRIMADDLGLGYFNRVGGTAEQAYAYVETQMKKLYPEEFGAAPTKRRATQTVEPARGSRAPKSKPKYTEKDLSPEQRAVMNRFVKTGALSKEDYIKELVSIGELG